MSEHLGGVADVYDAMGDRRPAMTESKVDVLAWIRNTPADNGWKAKERDAVANAVADLIEACEPLEELWVNECDMDAPIQRVVAAIAACTPAQSEGR